MCEMGYDVRILIATMWELDKRMWEVINYWEDVCRMWELSSWYVVDSIEWDDMGYHWKDVRTLRWNGK